MKCTKSNLIFLATVLVLVGLVIYLSLFVWKPFSAKLNPECVQDCIGTGISTSSNY